MPKRQHQPDGQPQPLVNNTGWSIGSNGLTQTGQTELMKHLGRQLQADYQSILKQPAPDRFRHLLDRLEEQYSRRDEEDR